MKYRHHIIVIYLFVCWLCQISGQVHENAIPYSVTENLPAITYFEDLPSIDSSAWKNKAESAQSITKQVRFASPIYTDLNPDNSGQWTETPSGSVWRLGIRSNNAYSLYVNMDYFLSTGTRMFVYGPEYQDLRGAFTSRNNNSAEVLSIAPVRGDRLVIELNLPTHQHSYGKIKMTKVYHDYLNIFEESGVIGQKTVNDCDEDINCNNGKYWQTEKRSVCKIISNGGLGTGTLMGNTGGSSTPYVLSAYHLINSAEIAAETIFLFNYETTGCQEELSTIIQSLSGASLLATTNHQVDFTLMKLYNKPPVSYQPFYAGWDTRNIISQTGVCIHHPFGNSKQIAIEYHPIGSEDIGEGFDENSTWKVAHWELGTTELGSSGAPLFNEQHRVIGTLTGGRSTCGYPRDDYFTKFGVSWDAYPEPSNQLKYWLDSAHTGQLVLDGYDPYGFNAEFCDTAWNLSSYDKLGLNKNGLAWGWITGHNSEGYTLYAERFEASGVLNVNGIYLNVAKAHAVNPLAYIELKVWEGDQYPEKEHYSGLFFIKDLYPGKVNHVSLDTILTLSGTFFVGYKIIYNAVSDTFALYHAINRGNGKASSMYVYDEDWYEASEPGVYGIATSLGIGISECYGKTHNPSTHVLNVYPNPCTNSLTLNLPGDIPVYELKCFDNNGRQVTVSLRQTEEGNTLYFNLKSGIYYLKIITAEKSFVARFIVLKE